MQPYIASNRIATLYWLRPCSKAGFISQLVCGVHLWVWSSIPAQLHTLDLDLNQPCSEFPPCTLVHFGIQGHVILLVGLPVGLEIWQCGSGSSINWHGSGPCLEPGWEVRHHWYKAVVFNLYGFKISFGKCELLPFTYFLTAEKIIEQFFFCQVFWKTTSQNGFWLWIHI